MDDQNGSAPVCNTTDSNEENLNSAPPQFPSEPEINAQNNTPIVDNLANEDIIYDQQFDYNNNYNYKGENYDEIKRPIIHH